MNYSDDLQIFKLKNQIQNYAWGSRTYIPELLGKPVCREPQAELWLGAHPKSPSTVQGEEYNLLDLINSNPHKVLGENIITAFKGKLPFLFKVLSAAEPLSIQVHPNHKQAKAGFLRENMNGIPLSAANRNYKDDNHKPELIYALTDFELMCGFQSVEEMIKRINYLKLEETIPLFYVIKKNAVENNLKKLYANLMNTNENKEELVLKLKQRTLKTKPANEHDELIFKWILKLADVYPSDMGVFSPLLLNLLKLKSGEALFIDDGILHSYLSGSGLEVMANSDNVLRGGLTSKNVDIPELLRILKFDVQNINIIQPECINGVSVYKTATKEFQLSRIVIEEDSPSTNSEIDSPEIILCTAGSGQISMENQVLRVKKGDSFFVPYSISGYKIEGNLEVFKVNVPYS